MTSIDRRSHVHRRLVVTIGVALAAGLGLAACTSTPTATASGAQTPTTGVTATPSATGLPSAMTVPSPSPTPPVYSLTPASPSPSTVVIPPQILPTVAKVNAAQLRARVIRAARAARYVKSDSNGDRIEQYVWAIFSGARAGYDLDSDTFASIRIGPNAWVKDSGKWRKLSKADAAAQATDGAVEEFQAIAGTLKDLGYTVVLGERVRLYEATATPYQVAAAAGNPALGEAIANAGVTHYVTSWYIGEDDLPVERVTKVKGTSTVAGSTLTHYYDWGVPFTLKPPKVG